MTFPQETITIRAMQAEDLDQVQAIDHMSFSMPWPASAYQYELRENPRSQLWVAEAAAAGENRVVGMVVVWLILDEAHIATLAVRPDYRNRGIASRLLAHALQEAIRKGSVLATLEVRANNAAAQNLYHRFRFEIAGRRPRYYRDNNEDALIMTASHLGPETLAWLEQGAWEKDRPQF